MKEKPEVVSVFFADPTQIEAVREVAEILDRPVSTFIREATLREADKVLKKAGRTRVRRCSHCGATKSPRSARTKAA